MDTQDWVLPETVPVPPGLVKQKMLLGLPRDIALLVFLLGVIPLILVRSLWCLPLAGLLWGFAKYQAKKDPEFLASWMAQLGFGDAYY